MGLIFCFRPGLIFSCRPGLIFFFQPGLIFFSDWCGDSPSRVNYTSIYIYIYIFEIPVHYTYLRISSTFYRITPLTPISICWALCIVVMYKTRYLSAKHIALMHKNTTFPQTLRKAHAPIREQLSKSAHLPDPTHAGTKYPVRENISLR